MNVDSANENGWHQPPTSFPAIPNLPSLALNPMARSSSSLNTSRPKLSLSGFSTPATSSPSLLPSTQIDPPALARFPSLSTGRPALLNAPSANLTPRPDRSLTPSLKLAIPSGQGQSSSNFSASHDYYPPATPPLEDDYSLSTPTASHSGEDRNPTLVPRGRDYDGDQESSYGYGRLNNGLGIRNGSEAGDAMSSMAADIRQALSRSRINASASGSVISSNTNGQGLVYPAGEAASGSQSSSRASSIRRQGRGRDTGLPEIGGLSLEGRRGSVTSLASSGRSTPVQGMPNEEGGGKEESPIVKDPERLVVVRRLGEGSGGAVELVRDSDTGRLLAKKVSLGVSFHNCVLSLWSFTKHEGEDMMCVPGIRRCGLLLDLRNIYPIQRSNPK